MRVSCVSGATAVELYVPSLCLLCLRGVCVLGLVLVGLGLPLLFASRYSSTQFYY